jgi:hypothetical protein
MFEAIKDIRHLHDAAISSGFDRRNGLEAPFSTLRSSARKSSRRTGLLRIGSSTSFRRRAAVPLSKAPV